MRIFVYGSLKRGEFNHDRWGFSRLTRYLGPAEARGLCLYDLGWYPCAVETGNEKDVIRGELYEILDEKLAGRIRDVETGAGYEERIMTVGGEPAVVYVYPEAPRGARRLPSGVWTGRDESCELAPNGDSTMKEEP